MSTASHRSYKSGSISVGDSRSTTTRPDSSKRDTKRQSQPPQSLLPSGRSHTSDQEQYARKPSLRRHVSNTSTSSSDYSSGSKNGDVSSKDARAKSGSVRKLRRRRSGDRSEGGSDRRRLAIIEMDTESTKNVSSQPHGNGSIRSRRGLPSSLAGLALVAAPDAALNSFIHLTPPSTAPIIGSVSKRDTSDPRTTNTGEGKGHLKTFSEALNMAPQDVGVVGTGRLSPNKDAFKSQQSIPQGALHPPIFQQSHSRAPSPAAISDESGPMRNPLSTVRAKPPTKRRSVEHPPMVTPGIGEENDVAIRVAAPVVVSLESAQGFQTQRRSSRKASPPPSNSTPQIAVQSVPAGNTTSPSSNTSPYLHYQPGVHATAGPLPPPPRAMFNIDVNAPPPPRPPRLNSPNPARSRGDIEAVKQALQLPPSVSAALASRSPKSTTSTPLDSPCAPSTYSGHSEGSTTASTNSSVLRHVKSIHRREGASAAVSDPHITTLDQVAPPEVTLQDSGGHSDAKIVEDAKPSESQSLSEEVSPIVVSQPPDAKREPATHENGHAEFPPNLTEKNKLDESPAGGHSPSRPLSHTKGSDTPSPPSKSFRNSLTTNLKRFASLPRTPSMSSRSSKSARRSSVDTQPSSPTPSPSAPLPLPLSAPVPLSPIRRVRPKIKSQYPSAMYCSEVFSRTNAVERCAIYAHKINELHIYDSGLGDWIIETRIRANMNRPVLAGGNTFTPQPRHTSRASIISEATFPRRPDASTATDLSLKTTDLSPTAPPVLPYPSLAQTQRFPVRTSSLASATPAPSLRPLAATAPNSKAGFFASLGRKASISGRREKPGTSSPVPSSSSSGTKLLTKNPSTNLSPRTVNIPNNPSVPGGPRAPPNRLLRSQTIIATSSPFSSTSSHSNELLTRRPSLFDLTQEPESVIDIRADPEFVRQVDKLVELLPNADRDVLAGYLRRAGQDILAIGQYLEDEKNGTLLKT